MRKRHCPVRGVRQGGGLYTANWPGQSPCANFGRRDGDFKGRAGGGGPGSARALPSDPPEGVAAGTRMPEQRRARPFEICPLNGSEGQLRCGGPRMAEPPRWRLRGNAPAFPAVSRTGLDAAPRSPPDKSPPAPGTGRGVAGRARRHLRAQAGPDRRQPLRRQAQAGSPSPRTPPDRRRPTRPARPPSGSSGWCATPNGRR